MKTTWIDVGTIAEKLQESCPFITFALIRGLDPNGFLILPEKIELSVFVNAGIGTWPAIEKILPVISVVAPDIYCEVVLLNRADPATRTSAIHDQCLFIQKGQEHVFHEFGQRSSLDYRILRAHQRRRGLVGGE